MTQLCHDGVTAATDDTETNECGCLPRKLYFQKQVVSRIWPLDGSLLALIQAATFWDR